MTMLRLSSLVTPQTSVAQSPRFFHHQIFIKVERLKMVFDKDYKGKNQSSHGNNYKNWKRDVVWRGKGRQYKTISTLSFVASKYCALTKACFLQTTFLYILTSRLILEETRAQHQWVLTTQSCLNHEVPHRPQLPKTLSLSFCFFFSLPPCLPPSLLLCPHLKPQPPICSSPWILYFCSF